MAIKLIQSVEATDENAPEKTVRTRTSTIINPFDEFVDSFRKAWDARKGDDGKEKSTIVKMILPQTGKDLDAWKNRTIRLMEKTVRSHIDSGLSVYTMRSGFVTDGAKQQYVKDDETGDEFPLFFLHVYLTPTKKQARSA